MGGRECSSVHARTRACVAQRSQSFCDLFKEAFLLQLFHALAAHVGHVDLAAAQERGAKVDGVMVKITRKAGVDGRLFGSVTTYDIAEALQGLGHEVERSAIRLPQGPLKAVGDYPIAVALHGDVVVQITVSVLGEQA